MSALLPKATWFSALIPGLMWAPLAAALAKDHTVIVPDLRGIGLSSYPDTGYDKKTQAQDALCHRKSLSFRGNNSICV
jgi:pimeloyl-ACP methyl ester carboxylesterase